MEVYSSIRLSLRSKEEILCICLLVSISICAMYVIELFIYILLLKFAISAILP